MAARREEEPAKIKMTGIGSEMNISINNIKSSVTVGGTTTINHHLPPGVSATSFAQTRRGHSSSRGNQYTSDDDSDSSDSDSEIFFAQKGVKMPDVEALNKMGKRLMNMAGQLTHMNMTGQSTNRAKTMFISPQGNTPTVHVNGQRVNLLRQRSRPPSQIGGHPSGDSCRNKVPVSQPSKPDFDKLPMSGRPMAFSSDRQLTKYERQTQTFKEVMRKVPHPHMIIDERTVYKIAPRFGLGWRRVFRHLCLEDAVIDFMYEDCGQVLETVQKLLLSWIQTCRQPDVKTLIEALVRADQMHITQCLADIGK